MRLVDISSDEERAPLRIGDPTALELTIVIPTLNEEKNIPIIFEKVGCALEGVNWEMVIVDDNSSDRSPEVMREMSRLHHNFRFIRRIGRSGLSTACTEGMLSSAAPIIAVMDADGQHDETKLKTMLVLIQSDSADVVVGSRFKDGAELEDFSNFRTKLSLWSNMIAQKIFKLPLKDSMGNFFMLRQTVLEAAAPHLCGRGQKLLFDILLVGPPDVRVAEVPIVFGVREHGDSKLSPLAAIDFGLQMWDRKFGAILPTKALIDMGSIFGFTLVTTIIQWAIMKISYAASGTFPNAALILPFASLPSAALAFRIQRALTPKRKRTRGLTLAKEFLAFCAISVPFVLLTMWVTTALIQPGDPRLRMLFGASLTASIGLLVASNWRKEVTQRQ